jgi:hypothetical protein
VVSEDCRISLFRIFSEEGREEATDTSMPPAQIAPERQKAKELEEVMNNGMQFLAGLFKMSTGKDMGIEEQKIEVDTKTGEVTMKFKLPIS